MESPRFWNRNIWYDEMRKNFKWCILTENCRIDNNISKENAVDLTDESAEWHRNIWNMIQNSRKHPSTHYLITNNFILIFIIIAIIMRFSVSFFEWLALYFPLFDSFVSHFECDSVVKVVGLLICVSFFLFYFISENFHFQRIISFKWLLYIHHQIGWMAFGFG